MKKLLGEARRQEILLLLKQSSEPITGTDLSKKAGVSRQVIVGDMTLLKARNEPILATSQGYVYIGKTNTMHAFERQIACIHSPEDAKAELYTLVDSGVLVKNVTIEHPVYGDLIASIQVANRHEVDLFLKKVEETGASYLSELTGGIHLHLIAASNEETINRAIYAMRERGFLAEE
ncbi:MAG: transcription repressor NadR [Paenisporosarcina sp.]